MLWDVGLGAGANAMAAIRCYEQTAALHPVRALEIISFENDLDSLRLAFAHRHHFPYLRHGAPAGLLGSGRWRSSTGAGLSWRLVEGDVFETLAEVMPRPDLVFYDLFSGRTHAEAWTLSSFRRLFEAFGERDAELFTYTASTAARVAMLGAGFLVATGRATDDKPESTIAFTPRALDHGKARRHDLLGADWLVRWERSGARYPSDLPEADRGEFEEAILRHEQFRGLGQRTGDEQGAGSEQSVERAGCQRGGHAIGHGQSRRGQAPAEGLHPHWRVHEAAFGREAGDEPVVRSQQVHSVGLPEAPRSIPAVVRRPSITASVASSFGPSVSSPSTGRSPAATPLSQRGVSR